MIFSSRPVHHEVWLLKFNKIGIAIVQWNLMDQAATTSGYVDHKTRGTHTQSLCGWCQANLWAGGNSDWAVRWLPKEFCGHERSTHWLKEYYLETASHFLMGAKKTLSCSKKKKTFLWNGNCLHAPLFHGSGLKLVEIYCWQLAIAHHRARSAREGNIWVS